MTTPETLDTAVHRTRAPGGGFTIAGTKKAVAAGLAGILLAACKTSPFQEALDHMGAALEGDVLGRCVTRSLMQEWAIVTPGAVHAFPVLRKEFGHLVAADDRRCLTVDEIDQYRRDLSDLSQALRRCPDGRCAVVLKPR